ncbi:MAG: histidine phosphatase family protein [Anaerolineae bacterium]|jgi:probable phosphoglycerate mutase|nr:histidine phosphatase family protein [Anaerolineae bacterium]
MRLIFVRHGESVWNHEGQVQGIADPPMSERGRAQAALVAERLAREFKPAAVYASALQRATETGRIIAARLGRPLHVDARLNEYDIGALTGLTDADIAEQYPEIRAKWEMAVQWVPIPGEEGLYRFLDRIMRAIEDIIAAHPGDAEAVVVTHGGVMALYLGDLIGLNPRQRMPWRFDNASISIVEPEGARPRIVRLNDTAHLRHE